MSDFFQVARQAAAVLGSAAAFLGEATQLADLQAEFARLKEKAKTKCISQIEKEERL